jgi:hypothetical protein
MVANLQKLSRVLEDVTPDRRLATTVRLDLPRIERDIAEKGESFVTVDGRKYKVVTAKKVQRRK